MHSADVLIIGTGQAGVPLAERLAAAGKKVVIVERSELGGSCVNYGCTPTKTMIASARAAHVARSALRLGINVPRVEVDFAAVVARKDAIVQRWRAGIAERLAHPGIRLVHGHARFVGSRTVEVGRQRLSAPTVIINTGARSTIPSLPGLSQVPFLDSERALELTAAPAHLIVLGGGYIGCELGQMFARFGSRVTIVDREAHLLAREAPEVSEALEDAFRAESIVLSLGVNVDHVAVDPGAVIVTLDSHQVLRGSHVLVAAGRRANTDELNCEAAGVELDGRGNVKVDDCYRTTADGVYAVGDVTGGPQFTHSSWDDHRLLFDVLQHGSGRGRDDRLIPYAVFTDPQVAGVGLSEQQARERGVKYELATLPFTHIARAVEMDETAGMMKLLIDPDTERVLGCRIVGTEAAEMIHVFVVLMQADASVRAIAEAEAIHPTLAEGIQSLVMQLPRFKLG